MHFKKLGFRLCPDLVILSEYIISLCVAGLWCILRTSNSCHLQHHVFMKAQVLTLHTLLALLHGVSAKEGSGADSNSVIHAAAEEWELRHHVFSSPSHSVMRNCRCSYPSISCKPEDVVFIHIPKTGGESIERMLGHKKVHDTVTERRIQPQLLTVAAKLDNASFVVAVVRNPYDRVLSWFRFCIHGYGRFVPEPQSICHPAIDIFNAVGNESLDEWQSSFSQWLAVVEGVHDPEPYFKEKFFSLNMRDWLVDGHTHKFVPDFVIRFENFDNDTTELMKCLAQGGAHLAMEIPHENDSSSENALASITHTPKFNRFVGITNGDIYTAESRRWVEKWFKPDFKLFGYKIED